MRTTITTSRSYDHYQATIEISLDPAEETPQEHDLRTQLDLWSFIYSRDRQKLRLPPDCFTNIIESLFTGA